jgi:hypothetical protein
MITKQECISLFSDELGVLKCISADEKPKIYYLIQEPCSVYTGKRHLVWCLTLYSVSLERKWYQFLNNLRLFLVYINVSPIYRITFTVIAINEIELTISISIVIDMQ